MGRAPSARSAWLSGGFVTDLLVRAGAEGRTADRALADIAASYGVEGGPWEYMGPPLVVG